MHASRILAVTLLCLTVAACGQQGGNGKVAQLSTDDQKVSYAIGMDIGGSVKSSLTPTGLAIDVDALVQGLRDAFAGADSLMTAAEMRETLTAFNTRAREHVMQQQQQQATENTTRGAGFLEENRSKPGVQTTASGLQYQVLTEGSGPKPKPSDTVSVHYRGTLIDGTEFDSSYSRGEPTTFQLGGVIPGWTEGLQLMSVGSKYKFFIPAALAYGERSPSPQIPPNSTLIFEVELLGIGDQAPQR